MVLVSLRGRRGGEPFPTDDKGVIPFTLKGWTGVVEGVRENCYTKTMKTEFLYRPPRPLLTTPEDSGQ